jgi:nucleoid DNA-binding protein
MAKAAKASSKKAMTKSAFVAQLAEKAEVTKKQVEAVLEEITAIVVAQVGGKGAGKFVLPGIARITLTRKSAVKGGEKKVNPLNGQEYVTKPKPAYNRVNIRPVKSLKEALK